MATIISVVKDIEVSTIPNGNHLAQGINLLLINRILSLKVVFYQCFVLFLWIVDFNLGFKLIKLFFQLTNLSF